MKKLSRYPYYVAIISGTIQLCPIVDNGPEIFAGNFSYKDVPFPPKEDLVKDISQSLNMTEQEILKLIHLQFSDSDSI